MRRTWMAVLAVAVLCAAPVAHAARARAAAKSARAAGRDTSVVLVRVGGEVITRADVESRLQEIPEQARAQFATPEGRQQLIDRMVEERVWMLTAMRHGVADRPKVREQLQQQRRDLLIRTWLQEVMAENATPSDSEAQAYYDAHADDYKTPATATLRHIQMKSENEARNVLRLAKAPNADWTKLVQRFSTDTLTRTTGGNLGTVTRDGFFPGLGRQPALAESAFAHKAGTVAGPFKSDKGWHVIKIEEVKEAGARPFDSVKSLILRQLSGQRSQEFYRQKLEQAKHDLGVRPDSAAIKRYTSQRKTAREMFKEAQELSAPEERIAAYQRLLETYPDSDVSAQAQFMVGFIQSEELKNYDEAEKAFRVVLSRYPKSELAPSAQWMVDHMRTEDAPPFNVQEADSSHTAPVPPAVEKGAGKTANKGSSGKP
jgi:peptidyl-prolyl cis-trans isomerase C